MQVKDIMTTDVITVTPQTKIRELARLLVEHDISATPVVENGKLVGIATEVDLISRHAPAKPPQYISLLWGAIPLRLNDYARYKEQVGHILAVRVEQIMTSKPTTIGPDDSIEHTAELMIKPGHRSLPVMEGDTLIGIVTRTDLVGLIETLEVEEADDGHE